MPLYLAQYTINAFEVSFSNEQPYEKKDQTQFEAEDDTAAIEIADKARYKTIGAGLINPTVTLDKLLRIEEVPLDSSVKK